MNLHHKVVDNKDLQLMLKPFFSSLVYSVCSPHSVNFKMNSKGKSLWLSTFVDTTQQLSLKWFKLSKQITHYAQMLNTLTI
jgi:hypothetical protein